MESSAEPEQTYPAVAIGSRIFGTVRDFGETLSDEETLYKELNDRMRSARLRTLGGILVQYPPLCAAARAEDKLIKLEIHDRDVQVEQGFIDAIADPCMHMVPNAITHGIKTGPERQQRGKPETGTITTMQPKTAMWCSCSLWMMGAVSM